MSLFLLREHIRMCIEDLIESTSGTSSTKSTQGTKAGTDSAPQAAGVGKDGEKKMTSAEKNAEKAIELAKKPPVGPVIKKSIVGDTEDALAGIAGNFLRAAAGVAQEKKKEVNPSKIKNLLRKDIGEFTKEMQSMKKSASQMKQKGINPNNTNAVETTSKEAMKAAGVDPDKK